MRVCVWSYIQKWCARNFVNGRALTRAYSVRQQLSSICSNDNKNGLNIDVGASCGKDMVSFLKCACAGLFLQSASRIPSSNEASNQGNSGQLSSSRGRYKTKVGGDVASIHPTWVQSSAVYMPYLFMKRFDFQRIVFLTFVFSCFITLLRWSSTLFGRNPAPKTLVYTEILVTKKTYLRGVTQIREEWLVEVAPDFFK